MNAPFIVLEGPDGAGTTKHTELLCENLRRLHIPVLQTAEPTQGGIGSLIRSILSHSPLPHPEALQLLFTADRADHVRSVIEPALARGETVVCDRYALSTVIYGSSAGVDEQWLRMINDVFLKPDMTIVTLPSFEVCQERIGKRAARDQFEKTEFQRIVHRKYEMLREDNCFFVDTSGEMNDASAMILSLAEQLLAKNA